MLSNFVDAWESLFGTYAPIEVVDQVSGSIYTTTDWGYVLRCAFFIIVTYCLLKMIGGVLSGKR